MSKELIKSPMNYIGGKHRLLSQILNLFPDNINTFYDVFGGGASLSLNVNSECVYYNDIVPYVSNMFNDLKGKDAEECLMLIHSVINKYNLNMENEEGFKQLRIDYNNGVRDWYMFYTLVCYSFNNQFRFNNKHEYNSSFRKHKSCFTDVTENKFRSFLERLNSISIKFDNKDFREVDFSNVNKEDLIYFDPPYLISCGNYNDGKRGFKGWTQQDDLDLMTLSDKLNDKGIKFAMSNMIMNKGMENTELINWSKKYNVHNLSYKSGNSNYRRNKEQQEAVEVLITNY